MKINNYTDLLAMVSTVNVVSKILTRFSLKVSYEGIVTVDLPEYIELEYAESFSNKIALALACVEEDRNNPIKDEEIDFINGFFGIKITRDDVTNMHSKYI